MKYLLVILLLCVGCASNPATQHTETTPPQGYIQHCIDYPDSIFCENDVPYEWVKSMNMGEKGTWRLM
jgi:hypothetical protein